MKGLFAFLLLLLVSAPEVRAERWILKNPRSPLVASMAIHDFEFGGHRYAVVNAPRFSPLEASLRGSSEKMFPDPVITLPATHQAAADPVEEEEIRAWHVRQLRYTELPAHKAGQGIVVAVIDTGVDYTHDALKEHMWVNEGEIAGNGIDDDNNGFVDDVHGYDFEARDADPKDGDSHGTHCAGIVAASKDSDSGARGVAPGAKIMAIRIIGWKQMGFLSDAVAGIKYAADNGAKVLSNSWRVYRSWKNFDPSEENIELLRQAVIYAGQKGAIFVAAAGNERNNLDDESGDPMYPGGFKDLDNLVVVAASNESGNPAYFTNYGVNRVTVAAPGDSIISTTPGNRWRAMSGTSMAAPLVAGAIARGLSGSFANREAVDKLVTTSRASDVWREKVFSGGTVELVDYLAD